MLLLPEEYFTTEDCFIPEILEKLQLNPAVHQDSWEHYYRNYNNALGYLCRIGVRGGSINFVHMPFMYIFRHTIELLLKYNLQRNDCQFQHQHRLIDLYSLLPAGVCPTGFREFLVELEKLESCGIIPTDTSTDNTPTDDVLIDDVLTEGIPINDGSCYKYYADKHGISFFDREELDVLPLLSYYASLESTPSFNVFPLCTGLNVRNRKQIAEFNFITSQSRGNGIIRTHYDVTLEYLLKGISKQEINLSDCYLPFLFLMRHSLELSLKANLMSFQGLEEPIENISVHRLVPLSRIYTRRMDWAKSQLASTDPLLPMIERDQILYNNLCANMNRLDSSSIFFRYPVIDRSNVLDAITSIPMFLEEYYAANSFISFAPYSFEQKGIIL